MTKIPYIDSNGHFSVEVQLTHAADVFLVDSINYKHFQSGSSFEYVGGHYTKTPVVLSVNGSGRWYLIVRGSNYQYRFF